MLREAAGEYLKRREAEAIASRYRAGYRDIVSLDNELDGWAGSGTWPAGE